MTSPSTTMSYNIQIDIYLVINHTKVSASNMILARPVS